jgi:hypothetical protein
MSAPLSRRPGRRPDPALRDLWQQRLARFEQSGLKGPAFCAQEGLALSSLYAWRRRLRPKGRQATAQQARLLPIHLLAAPTPVELLLPSGALLRLSPGCDLAFVRALALALGEQPC